MLPLKIADTQSIYSALINWLKQRNIQICKLVDMGFDGAATFSGVHARMKRNSPHAIFVHSHCHLLQRACVQAANYREGIKRVYITSMTLWMFFHYSQKRSENLKEVQSVLNLPKLKIVKPSDIC